MENFKNIVIKNNMKRILLILLLLFMLSCDVSFGQIITGEVTYNTNSARNELFSNPVLPFSSSNIQKNIIDKNYLQNKTALLKGQTDLKDRILAQFSDGSYGIIYKDNLTNVFYYTPDGLLTHNEIKASLDYPYKAYKYDINGNLVNTSLRVSQNETFIFSKQAKLIAHWIGELCYDENNKIIMSRKILK